MNWFLRNWRPVVAGAAVTAVAVAAAMISSTPSSTFERPLLVGAPTTSGDAYRIANGQGFLTPPAAATSYVHCKMNDLSGNLQCTDQAGAYVTLTKNGTPTYQVRTPIPTDKTVAQGRKGWNFDNAGGEEAAASSTTVNSLSGVSGFTVSVLATNLAPSSNYMLYDSRGAAAGSGIKFGWGNSTSQLYCTVSDGVNQRIAWIWSLTDLRPHDYTCVGTYSGSDWTLSIYQDGIAGSVTSSGTATTNAISNAAVATVGGLAGTSFYSLSGQIYEVQIRNVADSAATILARYRALLATGAYATPDANTVAHYKFNETSTGSGLRDHSGNNNHLTTVNGTPDVQYGDLPYPAGGMFSRRGVWFNGTDSFYSASSDTTADQATNDFSVTLILRGSTTGRVVSKRGSASQGWELYWSSSGVLGVYHHNGSTLVTGTVADAPVGSHSMITTNWNRSLNTVTAFAGGAATAYSVDTSTSIGSLTSNGVLTLGDVAGVASQYYGGALVEILISNGLTTLAEHQAMYKAFKVPTTLSYTQTTTRKYPLASEDGFGARLGVYGGSSTNPQWPIRYATGAKQVTLGTDESYGEYGFPAYGPTTNVIGRTNEFDSWSVTGTPIVVANAAEAPDGSMTADTIEYDANGENVYKQAVTSIPMVAGERTCGSVYYRRISGTCAGCFMWLNGATGTPSVALSNPSTWTRLTLCQADAPVANRYIALQCLTHGNCKIAVADAQLEVGVGANTTDPCTSTSGNVSQTCNAPLLSQSWTSKSTLMPTVLSRGEVTIKAIVEPWVYAPGVPRIAWHTGDESAYVAEAVEPVFVLKDQGGAPSAVVKHKPIRHESRFREYIASWDQDKSFGLTNTSPRKYASLSVDGTYGAHALSSRHTTSEAGQLDPVTPPSQRDYGSQTLYIGCPASSTAPYARQCLQGTILDWGWYARPEQKVKVDDSDLLVQGGFSGADFLRAQSIPRFECPAGVSSSNCWIWDMGELSGSLYDRVNGVALAPTGTPRYQAWTGLMARGQGRRGVNFASASSEATYAAAASVKNRSTSFTVDVLLDETAASTANGLLGTDLSGTTGWGIYVNGSTKAVACRMVGPAAATTYTYKTAQYVSGAVTHVSCVFSWNGTKWIVPQLFTNGIQQTGTTDVDGNITVPMTPSADFYVGNLSGAGYHNGRLYEVLVRNTADSAATILARYKQTIQQGTYWADDANTVAHYKMNESTITNGIGLRDHSGNGNHLTVVSGTPDPQYKDMPWPAGTGLTKPAVAFEGATPFTASSATVADPANNQPFSLVYWYKWRDSINDYVVDKGQASLLNPSYGLYVNASGQHYMVLRNSVGGSTTSGLTATVSDGTSHLVAFKWVWDGDSWVWGHSVDGAAFTTADSGMAGNVNGGAGLLRLGPFGANLKYMLSGFMFVKNYELTNADVAAMAAPLGASPLSTLTYARTNKACYEVGNDPVEGVRVRCFKASDVGFGYSSALAARPGNMRMGLGEMVHGAVQNLALQSEDATTTWTNNNTSDAANSAVAPDGTMTADTVTATAGAGDLRQAFASITAATHTYCQFLKRNGAADVAGFVRMVKNSDGTQIAQTAFTATTAWQRFCVSGTAVLNDTRIETQITTNGQSVYWWGAYLSTSNWMGVYCPTTTGSYTCNAVSSNSVAAANMTSWTRAQGTLSCSVQANSSSYVVDLNNGTNFNGALRLLPRTANMTIWNSTATVVQDLVGATDTSGALRGFVGSFDSASDFYGTRSSYLGTHGASYAGPASTWSTDSGTWTATGSTNLHLGSAFDASSPINGPLESCYLWKTR